MSINPQQGDLEQRRRYYDGFSARYEDGRDRGYHAFLDDEELAVILPRARGAVVLEAGCGTGLLLQHVAPAARQAVGVDLSAGMAGHARARGLAVSQGDLCRLPFADGTFDLIYSCKVLAHVPQLDRVFAELDRVTKPGGTLLLEVYNRHSLRYLVRRLRPGMAVADGATDADIYTRFDSLAEVDAAAPPAWRRVGLHGIRVATLVPQLFRVPGVGAAWAGLERALGRGPAARFGGFLMVEFRKA